MKSTLWWENGSAIYHIYPRSFADSNNDGFGDIQGIIGKLDHLKWLGVGALWMGPVFPSPQVDNGYDISDYCDVDPLFGTLSDLDELIDQAHKRDIRVLLDLVLNHSSTEHPWFKASKHDPKGPYGDFYHWHDPTPRGELPNNWRSFFSLPAWTWSAEREQYYLHLFTPEQADLNWKNPQVRKELSQVANFWLDRDVDGFRMDVINLISKADGYPSIPEGSNGQGYFIDGPDSLTWIQEFRSNLQNPSSVLLVGETPGATSDSKANWTSKNNKALNMVISFEHVEVDHGAGGRWDPKPFSIRSFSDVLSAQQVALAENSWPCLYQGNHDQPRSVSRFGDDKQFLQDSAIACATLTILQRGTPIVYQGDEIGMSNYPLYNPQEIQDIETKNAFQALIQKGLTADKAFQIIKLQARDNSRTPMQWNNAKHSGFCNEQITPWFNLHPDYPQWNVEAQQQLIKKGQPSILGAYQNLLSLRKKYETLIGGECRFIELPSDSSIIAFERTLVSCEQSPILVVINFSSVESAIPELFGWTNIPRTENAIFSSHKDSRSNLLEPWESLVLFSESDT